MENRGSDVSNGARSGRRVAETTKPGGGAANLSARPWRPEDLSFCGDVYPVEVLDDVVCLVGTTLQDMRAAHALEHMASGLWLSTEAVRALESPGARANFRARLADAGLVLSTLDAVAYGDFRTRAIKEGLFLPDWSDERRLHYTIAAADVALLLALALSAGCGTARRSEALGNAPMLASAAAQRGQKVFMEYCNACHPGGAGGLGPAINDKPLPGFLIRCQVRQGLGAMPGFAEETISDSELDDLVAYLQALRRAGSD